MAVIGSLDLLCKKGFIWSCDRQTCSFCLVGHGFVLCLFLVPPREGKWLPEQPRSGASEHNAHTLFCLICVSTFKKVM